MSDDAPTPVADILLLADAIVARLEAEPACAPAAVERAYVLPAERHELTGAAIKVVPLRETGAREDRGRTWRHDYEVAVVLLAPLPEEAAARRAEMDRLLLCAQRLADLFRDAPLGPELQFVPVEIGHVPLWDQEFYDKFQLFAGIVNLTFRGWR